MMRLLGKVLRVWILTTDGLCIWSQSGDRCLSTWQDIAELTSPCLVSQSLLSEGVPGLIDSCHALLTAPVSSHCPVKQWPGVHTAALLVTPETPETQERESGAVIQ